MYSIRIKYWNSTSWTTIDKASSRVEAIKLLAEAKKLYGGRYHYIVSEVTK